MTKPERIFFDFVQKYICLITISAVTILGLIIRIFGADFQSDDYQSFLSVWWTQIEYNGIEGLGQQEPQAGAQGTNRGKECDFEGFHV